MASFAPGTSGSLVDADNPIKIFTSSVSANYEVGCYTD